ncbi:hypothetical protein J6590_029659 [Homalodisca vitripennis]|nr:hypothetical protein J6590_029659 [Homalodisca vitripennis]
MPTHWERHKEADQCRPEVIVPRETDGCWEEAESRRPTVTVNRCLGPFPEAKTSETGNRVGFGKRGVLYILAPSPTPNIDAVRHACLTIYHNILCFCCHCVWTDVKLSSGGELVVSSRDPTDGNIDVFMGTFHCPWKMSRF